MKIQKELFQQLLQKTFVNIDQEEPITKQKQFSMTLIQLTDLNLA